MDLDGSHIDAATCFSRLREVGGRHRSAGEDPACPILIPVQETGGFAGRLPVLCEAHCVNRREARPREAHSPRLTLHAPRLTLHASW